MFNGIGTIYYGKKNYRAEGETEIFDITKWFAFTWLPILPLGSYTIERPRRQDIIQAIARTGISSETIFIHGQRSLDVPQVLWTYLKGWGGTAATFVALGAIGLLFA